MVSPHACRLVTVAFRDNKGLGLVFYSILQLLSIFEKKKRQGESFLYMQNDFLLFIVDWSTWTQTLPSSRFPWVLRHLAH
jgi:hypothetical protein